MMALKPTSSDNGARALKANLRLLWTFINLKNRINNRNILQSTKYTTVYRVWDGIKAFEEGGSWTTDDPRDMQDWRNELAVRLEWNDGTYLTIGRIHVNDYTISIIEPVYDPRAGRLLEGGATEIFPAGNATIYLIERGLSFDG